MVNVNVSMHLKFPQNPILKLHFIPVFKVFAWSGHHMWIQFNSIRHNYSYIEIQKD